MELKFRELKKEDFFKGYIGLLSQLTVAPAISYKEFEKIFDEIVSNKLHKIFVLEENNKIIASGTLLIERKIIHQGGLVGHIEDIVVDFDNRGKKIGECLINHLINHSNEMGCYKVILDCLNNLEKFYEKCGLEKKGTQMVKYF